MLLIEGETRDAILNPGISDWQMERTGKGTTLSLTHVHFCSSRLRGEVAVERMRQEKSSYSAQCALRPQIQKTAAVKEQALNTKQNVAARAGEVKA